ncbi:Meiotic sister-chromatid recombination protein 3 [Wickerhamomyces ciferrii]|uniref:Meiotic sister-chromatid recombination protein 3 n=1 Tax=Wickerhamomyces ciferrii (strain ATCC 14091 / BCRC 22168 / CBS 111 / JCM 3599 / NBRC 0793 / NRRL Y-1031 F-60-10) TaxID=1206466 RepID=K0KP74_WICCF|nr:Meiotic sister-chromatid recombination protein 3 [Wickerhamomyces ciferrii]CCH42923.1 Meiotic sister-chromatid recombination protein 3 [Wickerhamomyces ciferrii]
MIYQTQPKQDYNYLSTNAANQAIRTYSLTSNPYTNNHGSYGINAGSRTNSLNSRSYQGFRSNSINGLGNYRTNSLRSNSNSLRQQNDGDGTTIVHTTKTLDEYGRLKSITTETIKKMGSFELTKTETKNLSLPKHPGNKRTNSIDGGLSPPIVKYAGSITSSQELESIKEDDEIKFPGFHRGLSGIQEGEDSGNESGDSIYSDAFDIIPKNLQQDEETLQPPISPISPESSSKPSSIIKTSNSKPKTKKRVSIEDNVSILSNNSHVSKGSKYKDYSVNYWNNEPKLKKKISDQEMYDKAYQLALGKVYGEQQVPPPQQQAQQMPPPQIKIQPYQTKQEQEHPYKSLQSKTGFKRHSMRQSSIPKNEKNYNYQLNNKFGQEEPQQEPQPLHHTIKDTPSEETAVEEPPSKTKTTKKKKKFNLFKLFKIK